MTAACALSTVQQPSRWLAVGLSVADPGDDGQPPWERPYGAASVTRQAGFASQPSLPPRPRAMRRRGCDLWEAVYGPADRGSCYRRCAGVPDAYWASAEGRAENLNTRDPRRSATKCGGDGHRVHLRRYECRGVTMPAPRAVGASASKSALGCDKRPPAAPTWGLGIAQALAGRRSESHSCSFCLVKANERLPMAVSISWRRR